MNTVTCLGRAREGASRKLRLWIRTHRMTKVSFEASEPEMRKDLRGPLCPMPPSAGEGERPICASGGIPEFYKVVRHENEWPTVARRTGLPSEPESCDAV